MREGEARSLEEEQEEWQLDRPRWQDGRAVEEGWEVRMIETEK